MRLYPRIRLRPGMIPPPMSIPQTLPTSSASNIQMHIKPPSLAERPTTSSSIVISSVVSGGAVPTIPSSSPLRLPVETPINPLDAMRLSGGECMQCGVQFKHRRALTAHMADCGVAAKCPFCPMVLRHRQMLVEHVETHRPGYVA